MNKIQKYLLHPALVALSLAAPLPAIACGAEIQSAALRAGVPVHVAAAVSTVESGQSPFAVNVDGQSYHPASAAAAIALVREKYNGGARYIDVGCMQISLRHHPDAFRSLAAAFDPAVNVAYGVAFLAALYQQHGSWGQAIVNYHSGNADRQAEYAVKVEKVLASFHSGARP
jgi:soluble lytic murein transglycosylase-like protein